MTHHVFDPRSAGRPSRRWGALLPAVLLAFALVAGACGSSVVLSDGEPEGGGETGTSADTGDDASRTDDSGTTTADGDDPVPTAVPEAPTAEPTEEPTPEPTPIPTPAVDVALVESVVLSSSNIPPEIEECLVAALVDDPALADEFADLAPSAGYDDLSDEAKEITVTAGAECLDADTFADAISQGILEGMGQSTSADFELELDDDIRACFTAEFENVETRKAVIALGLSDDELTSANAGPMIDVLVECLPGSFYADLFSDLLAQEASLDLGIDVEVFDIECVTAVFDQPDFIRPFLEAALDAESDGGGLETASIASLLQCIAFGAIIQGSLAEEGIVISDDSADCIDREARESGLIDLLIADEEPTDSDVAGLLTACLSAEELLQIPGA